MVPTEQAVIYFNSNLVFLTKFSLHHNIHREIHYLRRVLKMMRR